MEVCHLSTDPCCPREVGSRLCRPIPAIANWLRGVSFLSFFLSNSEPTTLPRLVRDTEVTVHPGQNGDRAMGGGANTLLHVQEDEKGQIDKEPWLPKGQSPDWCRRCVASKGFLGSQYNRSQPCTQLCQQLLVSCFLKQLWKL